MNFYRKTFWDMTNLGQLDLSLNLLSSIDIRNEAKPNRPLHISEVNFFGNLLTNFSWDEKILRAKTVDLSNNQVTKFSLHTNPERVLRTFNLNKNFLREFEVDVDELHPEDRFTFIIEDDPSLDCSCFLPYYQKRVPQIAFNFGTARCVSPPNLKGRLARNLPAGDLLFCDMPCGCFKQDWDNSLQVNCSSKVELTISGFKDISFHPISFFQEIVDALKDRKLFTDNSREKQVALDFENFLVDIGDRNLEILPVIPENFQFKVTEISAPNNFIGNIEMKNLGDHLKYLDLRNNKLRTLSENAMKLLKKTKRLHLGDNPWNCDCSLVKFLNAMYVKGVLVDYENIYCENFDKKSLAVIGSDQVCYNWWLISSVLGTCFGIIGMLVAMFYKFKKDIKMFLYHSPISHNLCFGCVSEEELDEDKIYDAFICFADLDNAIVASIINQLENGPGGFKCLVGVRDWIAGEMIPELVSFFYFLFLSKLI